MAVQGRRPVAAGQLPARRDARVHEARLQQRQLPRGGPRQGRLHAVAVRLRSRPATTSASRGRSIGRRVDLAVPEKSLMLEKITGRGAAHRRQALRHRPRRLPDAAALAQGRGPERRRRHARCPSASSCLPSKIVFAGKAQHAEDRRARQVFRRLGPRRHPARPVHDQQRSRSPRSARTASSRAAAAAGRSSSPGSTSSPSARK